MNSAVQTDRDSSVLRRFVEVYCRKQHERETLCEECNDLLQYAQQRRQECPHDPRPKCKDCRTHCYKPEYRDKIKTVMRFSGMHFVKRGRLDWLVRYFI